MMAASTSSLGTEAAPNLAWKWILEKLVDLPAFGLTFIKGIGSNPSSFYLQHCRPLRITLVKRCRYFLCFGALSSFEHWLLSK
jgi:hypothetical protein